MTSVPSKPKLKHIGEHIHRFRSTHLKTSCSTSLTFTPGRYPDLAAWVTRCHGLFLRVQFLLSDVCKDTERGDLIEALGVVLRDAEIWKFLGLQASLIVPESYCRATLPLDDLILSLDPLQTSSLQSVTKIAGPFPTSTFSALKPPSGISIAHINNVDIEFDFSFSRRGSLQSEGELGTLQTIGNSRCEHIFLDVNADRLPRNHSWSSDHTGPSSVLENPSFEERSSHGRQIQPQGRFTNLVKLMDAGLRTVLYGANFKAHPDLEALNLSPMSGLIETAPSVFDPEYHKAVWQRSELYLNITHSLNAVGLRARSETLRNKLQRLQPVRIDNNPDVLHSIIKARLWESTTQGLARSINPQDIPSLDPVRGYSQIILCNDSQNLMEHDIPQNSTIDDCDLILLDHSPDLLIPEDEVMLLESSEEEDNDLLLEDEVFGSLGDDDMLLGGPDHNDVIEDFLLEY